MSAYIFDTETNARVNPEIIEASIIKVDLIFGQLHQVGQPVTVRCKPVNPISMGAMATHHIMDEDLVDCLPSSSFMIPQDAEYLIGHNIRFDWEAAGKPDGVKLIDTCAIARKLWPESDSHSQGALMYLLHREVARDMVRNAHSAEADVLMNKMILESIVKESGIRDLPELHELSESSLIPELMPFGKHKGVRIEDIPADYRQWLTGEWAKDPSSVDPYLKLAFERAEKEALRQRSPGA